MIEIIGGVWAAGETKTFTINGERLEILEAQYPVDVMLMDKSGAQLSIMKGSEASFFSAPKEGFQTVQISSAQAQVIRVFIGSGDAGTRRISSSVSVIDGGRARVDAGIAFAATAGLNPGAGNYAFLQLWNPAGSGKRLVVDQMAVSLSVAGSAVIFPGAGPLTTLVSTLSNKKAGAANGVGEVRTQSSAISSVFPQGTWQGIGSQVGSYTTWKPTHPIVVLPGWGVLVQASATNVGAQANFEWFEEAL
jgi:hypothetical protein